MPKEPKKSAHPAKSHVSRAPHAATVQPRIEGSSPVAKQPHPATIQRRAQDPRPPHPATVVQTKASSTTPVKPARVGRAAIQRAAGPAYDVTRNVGDVDEAKKAFPTISKNVALTNLVYPNQAAGNLPIYSVPKADLPEKVRGFMTEIQAANDVTWVYSKDANTGIREPHSNRSGLLPNFANPGNLQGLAAAYAQYANEYKLSDDIHGGDPRYIEFHVNSSGLGKAFRLLYDYINNRFFISISHYNVWSDKGGTERNPFFLVV